MKTVLTRRPAGSCGLATPRPVLAAVAWVGVLLGLSNGAFAGSRGRVRIGRDSPGPVVAATRAKTLAATQRDRSGTGQRASNERQPVPTTSQQAQRAADAPIVVPPIDAIGSISVGHPHEGYLVNGVRMPAGDEWVLAAPDQAWGTDETVHALVHCIRRVHEQFPGSPKAIIGAISLRHGGPFPPHKSHRSGRDADVYYYIRERGKRWYVPATADNLDRARTWALVRAVVTETDVEYLLIDRSVQVLLEEYALGIGEDPEWVSDLFHGSENRRALIKHIPGHTGHMHLRFFNPIAQQRGRQAYDQLVAQGHIQLPVREITHTVESGDTLSELAQRYHTTVEKLTSQNQLEGTKIRVGQRLVIQERRELRGARDPIVVPPRRLPPERRQRDEAVATRALLLELERRLDGVK